MGTTYRLGNPLNFFSRGFAAPLAQRLFKERVLLLKDLFLVIIITKIILGKSKTLFSIIVNYP